MRFPICVSALRQVVSQMGKRTHGLSTGLHCPTFTLPDLHGKWFEYVPLHGTGALIVFVDPNVRTCRRLLHTIIQSSPRVSGDDLQLIFVSRGLAEDNRRHFAPHLPVARILLQADWSVSSLFMTFEVPSAFLVGRDGNVSDSAVGIAQIVALWRAQNCP